MDSYKIIITPDAEEDLFELRNYIADVLLARDTARNYIRTIRKEIATLSEMPARYKPVDDEPPEVFAESWRITSLCITALMKIESRSSF